MNIVAMAMRLAARTRAWKMCAKRWQRYAQEANDAANFWQRENAKTHGELAEMKKRLTGATTFIASLPKNRARDAALARAAVQPAEIQPVRDPVKP